MKRKVSLKDNIINFVVLTLIIAYCSYASTLVQDDRFTVGVFIFLIILFAYKKLMLDFFILPILVIWLLINYLSSNIPNEGMEFSYITLAGVTLRMVMPYLMIKIVGSSFFKLFIKYIYVLAIISLPLFLIQSLFPTLFISLAKYLNFMTQEDQYDAGGWYAFVYMYSGWGFKRNCGFAWEPGAYAVFLIFSLIYQFSVNGFKVDKYILVFSAALITTMSTAGYLAFFIIFLTIILKRYFIRINPVFLLLLIIVIGVGYYSFNKIDFMKDKINLYWDSKDATWKHFSGMTRVNRIGEAVIALDDALHWPFGNGIVHSKFRHEVYNDAMGPNSLAAILKQFGCLGLFFILYSIFRFFKFLSKSQIIGYFFFIAFCIVLFSNPFTFRYLIFIIVYYYLLYIRGNISVNEPNFN